MKILFSCIFAIIIVVFVYLVLVPGSYENQDDFFVESNTIVLQTPTIEYLAPHQHLAHNTVHDSGHHVTVRSNIIMAQEDMWLTGFKFTIENAPVSTLHHAQFTNLDSPSNTCGITGQPADLLNLGEDTLHTNEIIFDEPQGIFIPEGHRLQLLTMFHNPEPPIGVGGDYFDVSARLELVYEPALTSNRTTPVEFHLMHLDDIVCAGIYTFSVPPNSTNYLRMASGTPETNPAIVKFDTAGEIVYIGGHLHGWEGGKYLELLLNGEIVRRFDTKRSDRPDMQWETPHHPENIKIEAGDIVSISATYDNPQSEEIVGAMGMVGFYFVPDVAQSANTQ